MESRQTDQLSRPIEKTGRPFLGGYLTLVFIFGVVFFLDQWTKAWVRDNLAFGESIRMPFDWLPSTVRILHWRNSGAAFGFFQEGAGFFTVLAVVVALLIIYYFPRIERSDWSLRLAMGLQLGGALGNLIDRLQHGYVTDFISVAQFPVFNIADTSITFGVIVLLLGIWFGGSSQPAHEEVLVEEQA
jgi:signal peptidase II